LEQFRNETLEKYPDCEFDTGRSHRHSEDFNPDNTVTCVRCIRRWRFQRIEQTIVQSVLTEFRQYIVLHFRWTEAKVSAIFHWRNQRTLRKWYWNSMITFSTVQLNQLSFSLTQSESRIDLVAGIYPVTGLVYWIYNRPNSKHTSWLDLTYGTPSGQAAFGFPFLSWKVCKIFVHFNNFFIILLNFQLIFLFIY